MPRIATTLALTLGLAALAPASHAADAASSWVVPAPRLNKTAYLSNLTDGASIETPFVLKFGVTGIGIAPTVKPVAGAGHHHLLVNRELPMDFGKPLPFNDQYIHFGKGQMETVLTFAPGQYALRLVMADERHIPNFVYGKPVNITVTKKNDSVDPKSLVVKGVAILEPAAGASVRAPFRVALHASGLNVSNAAITDAGFGHFRMRIKPDNGREESIDLTNGYTEVWLRPPAGGYTARVEFIDNAAPDKVLSTSEPVSFRVQR
ncbi:MAG: DUF4399 domain-containing protein [Burkholderiales bacterium]